MYLNNEFINKMKSTKWLTLTWDVFKYNIVSRFVFCKIRLTLTWDVFKLLKWFHCFSSTIRLTLTWDVFK